MRRASTSSRGPPDQGVRASAPSGDVQGRRRRLLLGQRGTTLAIVGESGSGKSTVANMVLKLLEPTDGTVTYEGKDISTLKGAELLRLPAALQPVFQNPVRFAGPDVLDLPPRSRSRCASTASVTRRAVRSVLRRAARHGRAAGSDHGPLPERAVRRPAPARRHRARPGAQPRRHRPATRRSPPSTCSCRTRSCACSTTCRPNAA